MRGYKIKTGIAILVLILGFAASAQAASYPLMIPTPSPTPAFRQNTALVKKSSSYHGYFEGRVRVLFYQDQVNITDPVNGDFAALSHHTAICPGFAYFKPINYHLRGVVELCGFYGFADARGTGNNPSLTQTYASSRASLVGMRLVPSLEWAFTERGLKMGLGIPLILQSVSWGEAGSGTTATSKSVRFPGAVITFEAMRDRYGFIGDFGFISKLTQATYSFGMSYRF